MTSVAIPADEQADVVVIGGGPAGLSVATALRRARVGRVLVLDRSAVAGGIPLQCGHRGFGLAELRRPLTGAGYARTLVDRALDAGVEIRTATSVFVDEAGRLLRTGPDGPAPLAPGVVLLATGARERSRSARLVAGTRPAGVFTTGQLQQFVRHGLPVGTRALVVGAEHVSYSAVMTLREAGVATEAMVTTHEAPQSLPAVNSAVRHLLGIPVLTRTAVAALHGRHRLSSVTLERTDRPGTFDLEVDTVVFTGDWIPERTLAAAAGLALDPGTGGPAVDDAGRTSRAGWYAAGNVVHPVETAERTAAVARATGRAMAEGLGAPAPPTVAVRAMAPLAWVWPNRVGPVGAAAGAATLLRSLEFTGGRWVGFWQDGRELASYRLRHATPNRSLRVAPTWRHGVDPAGGDVTVTLY